MSFKLSNKIRSVRKNSKTEIPLIPPFANFLIRSMDWLLFSQIRIAACILSVQIPSSVVLFSLIRFGY